ncbi:MAG: glycine oxidase ThiO [Gammaproteobacteria bacterium]|nr:glycine oxidase ThiO [Gammaproteobacteria bacterium]
MTYPVSIIGGGIIGLLCAKELVEAGYRVALYERNSSIGRESSWAGGGILSPLYPWRYPDAVTALARHSQREYPQLCDALRQSRTDPEWTQSGLLIINVNDHELALNWAERHGIVLELVSSDRVKQLEPELALPVGSVAWMPDIAQVRNPRLLQALHQYLLEAGCEFHSEVEVTGFSVENRRLVGFETSQGEVVQTRQCIVAAGSWSGALLEMLNATRIDVAPVRGQMLLFKGRPGLLSRIVLQENRYLIPRRDGRVLAGSTLEYVGFNKSVTPEAREDLTRAAVAMVPALADCEIETQWAGLRPGSPNGIPYIGSHPEVSGVMVCAGHFRNGFVLGPASAKLAVDLLLDREPLLDPGPYALNPC